MKHVLLATALFVPTIAAQASELDGSWSRPCVDQGTEIIHFSGSNFELSYKGYTEADCKTAFLTVRMLGQYALGAEANPQGAKNLDYTMMQYKMTSHYEEITKQFNETEYCGYTDWQTDVEKDLTDRECGSETMKSGTPYFSIAKIEGSTLYHGTDDGSHDGSSAEARHTTLDMDAPYTKR